MWTSGDDWLSSEDPEDLFAAVDGYTTRTLSGLALGTVWIPGVNVVTAATAATWGVASMANSLGGGPPLSQTLFDDNLGGLGYQALVGEKPSERVNDLAVGAKNRVEDVAGFAKDAGGGVLDTLGF